MVVHRECDKIGREGRGLPCVGEARDVNDERMVVDQSKKEWDYCVGVRSVGRKQRVIGRRSIKSVESM